MTTSKDFNTSELDQLFNNKLTENGDESHISTNNKLLDILFKSAYYEKHLENVSIGNSNYEQVLSMFIRDPRCGLGRRDLGRKLMAMSGVSPRNIAIAGRFDDLFKMPGSLDIARVRYMFDECKNGNELAKKWMPRYSKTNMAKTLMAREFANILGMNKQTYGRFIKANTVESHLSNHEEEQIDFSKLPSLALKKYWALFAGNSKKHPRTDFIERFNAYLESVKKGTSKMNVNTMNVYDVYSAATSIDPDIVFSKFEKVYGSWLPIVDTSGSMFDKNDSIGKALAIGHYLGKTSTYCPNKVMSFSSQPKLIELGNMSNVNMDINEYLYTYKESWSEGNVNIKWLEHMYKIFTKVFKYNPVNHKSTLNADPSIGMYIKEIASMYTGDYTNTNFAAVMDILGKLYCEFPEYLVVLSDMEFDCGSSNRKNFLMRDWKERGINTKIVWWNLNSRNQTVPETDEYGNIYMSGYSPELLKFIESGFDACKFMDKLVHEYAQAVNVEYMLEEN